MWPADLSTIKRVGGITSTELWMVKERIEAGHMKQIEESEKAFGKEGTYYTLFADETGVYAICTKGIFGARFGSFNDDMCCVVRINKVKEEVASRLLSGYPYD